MISLNQPTITHAIKAAPASMLHTPGATLLSLNAKPAPSRKIPVDRSRE